MILVLWSLTIKFVCQNSLKVTLVLARNRY